MKNIFLDFDGVIVDIAAARLSVVADLFGLPVEARDLSRERVEAGESALSLVEYDALQKELFSNKERLLSMREVEGAVASVRTLLNEGHAVTVVTARSALPLAAAEEWLRVRGLLIPVLSVGYRGDKNEHVTEASIFVDDDVRIVAASRANARFVFSWPYNNAAEVPYAVCNWGELVAKIRASG